MAWMKNPEGHILEVVENMISIHIKQNIEAAISSIQPNPQFKMFDNLISYRNAEGGLRQSSNPIQRDLFQRSPGKSASFRD